MVVPKTISVPINSITSVPNQDEAFAGAPMLRYGEYSPNNPQYRVAAAPYVGLGEYEQRKRLLLQQRRAEYKQYVADVIFHGVSGFAVEK